MIEDRQEPTPLERAADTAQTAYQIENAANKAKAGASAAHTSQAAHAAAASAKGGASAAGATTGTALAGPLGTIVGALVTSRTFWKVIAGIVVFIGLWMFIIANMIGIIMSYLGFANADAFANEAQSKELAALKSRIEQILADDNYEKEICDIIERERDNQLQEINSDKASNYSDFALTVIDEYETKLKKNLSFYLSILLAETLDDSSKQSFLGYSNILGLDMETDLTSSYDNFFVEASQAFGVPKALLVAIAKAESDFNPNVISSAGAIGIMQLMPGTAASLGVNPYDPRDNIMGGAKYIAGNIEQFKGCPNGLELAIAAYNAGPGAVIKYNYQIPPYKETQNYVKKVLGYIHIQGSAGSPTNPGDENEDLSGAFGQLKLLVEDNVDSFFSWSVTDEKETETTGTVYYFLSESGKTEVTKETYDKLKLRVERLQQKPILRNSILWNILLR